MYSRSLGIVAICAVAANALLLPPGTDNSDLLNPLVNPKARSIQVPCSGCAFPSDDADSVGDFDGGDDQIWFHRSYEVNLEFGVSNDGQRLELNGEPIYSPNLIGESQKSQHSVYVNQVSPSGVVTPLEITASDLKASDRSVLDSGDTIVLVKFQILALEQRRVAGLPEVTIDLLRMSNGELFIVTVDNVLKPDASSRPKSPIRPIGSSKAKSCGSLPSSVCQIRNMFFAAIETVRNNVSVSKPCPHRHNWSDRLPAAFKSHIEAAMHADDGKSHHDYQQHIKSSTTHRIHALTRGFLAILIPIFAGIAVGLIVSFIGLLVGRLCVALMRGRRRGCRRVVVEDLESGEEKMLAHDEVAEFLPAYEDAPAYEEIVNHSR